MKAVILGCGTSSGVPRIGNDWGTCDPGEPRNRRRRASIMVEDGATRILIDTTPDLREQLLSADVSTLGAVVWTHDHADHCHGIDDLRQVYHASGVPVDGYAREQTLATLSRRFAYAFAGREEYPAVVRGSVLPDDLTIGGVRMQCVDQPHGAITSVGIRFECGGKSIGYATDFHEVTEEMAALYQGADVWIVDALRYKPHPTHPHLAMTLDWIERLGVGRAILTHMDQTMDYATLRKTLPAHVEPGFDGMEIALS
jgi:phosphoribosyl 1,2-cyclic phosphate phosphodiesterase